MNRVPNMIGVLGNRDVDSAGTILVDKQPVQKAILLVFMPTCPHCQEPKRWFETTDISDFGVHKLAIDVSEGGRLADRVPGIFNFHPAEFTVPKLYVIRKGRPIRQLKHIGQFHPVRSFLPQRKKVHRRSRRRANRQ